MGNCCASGGRDGGFDQKEDQLAPELRKEDGELAERSAKPPKETPEDISFKTTAKGITTSNQIVDVSSLFLNGIENVREIGRVQLRACS